MAFDDRARRLKVKVPVQLTDDSGKVYTGMTNDVSVSGFSAFLRCKEEFVINELVNNAFVLLNFPKLEQLFFDKEFQTVFNLDAGISPQPTEVVRVENSWLRGFEVFIAARFPRMDEQTREKLTTYIDEHTEDLDQELLVDAEEEVIRNLDVSRGDTIIMQFPGRYLYIPIVRDICDQLAREIGFSDIDCFKIKVAADEVFSNAFKHGSPKHGENLITVKVTLDRKGIFIRVRDEGGIPFNYKRYRDFDRKFPDSSRTGLHLVDKFMDGWVVNTKKGEYTEVSFFKNREALR